MITLNTKRVDDVFKDSLENVSLGKKPNISGNMLKHGYSPSSSKALKVKTTKRWSELLAMIDDNELLNELYGIALDKGDKRPKLQAIDMLLKLKDLYPQKDSKLVGLFGNIT